jgi:putative ABC transport system ATP-binding protein
MNILPVRVELVGVSHAWGQGVRRVPVLEGVTERFGAGEFVVLLGRSGSGKTTLLQLIGGMEVPERGAIHVMGQPISACDESGRAELRRRYIGMVFQSFNLVPTLCAWENVALPLTLLGVALGEARARAQAQLTSLGLAGLAARMPEQLSGGEQQRVAIARAVCHRPPLLLADEPTGNLDLETAVDVVSQLVELGRLHGITLIMATHSLEVAGRADRVLRMVGGRLVAAEA